MSVADCPARKRRLSHDVGPDIQIMEIVSDGGFSLYQVAVNGVPDGELHLQHLDSRDLASVVWEQAGNVINGVLVATAEIGWWLKARKDVEKFLEGFYRDAIIRWYTKGAYVE
jgi:hypothetical protein